MAADSSWASAVLPLSSDSESEPCPSIERVVEVGIRRVVIDDADETTWQHVLIECFADVVAHLGTQAYKLNVASGASGLCAEYWSFEVRRVVAACILKHPPKHCSVPLAQGRNDCTRYD